MMKMKRFVAMALVLVFVLSFAVSVSAAEITWNSGGTLYSAIAEQTSQGGNVALFTSTTMYHWRNDYNMETVIRANTDCSVTASISWSGSQIYRHIVEQAVRDEGLLLGTTFLLPAEYSLKIPGNAETGEYMIGAYYYTADGDWSVYNLSIEPELMLGEGNFYNAPQITDYFFHYYKVG